MEGCIARNRPSGDSQQTFPGLAQRRIVLSGRPLEVGLFHPGNDPLIRSHAGTCPEPGQQDVHGEIGDARQAEKGTRGGVIGGDQVPVMIPEGIRPGLQDGGGLEEEIVTEGRTKEDFDQPG